MNERHAYHQRLALRLLRLTEEQHAELVYAEGIRYLELYMDDTPHGRAVLEAMPQYWAWWTRQWAIRTSKWSRRWDIQERLLLADKWERAQLAKTYYWVHDAEVLRVYEDVRIARDVMSMCYASLTKPPTP